MKRIKFVVAAVFEQFGPNHPDNPRFAVDQVEDMRDDQAERWLKRRKAELVEDLGPDVDPVIAGADPEKVGELREAIAHEHAQEIDGAAADLDEHADDLAKALDAGDETEA